jgi:hypothetical protein
MHGFIHNVKEHTIWIVGQSKLMYLNPDRHAGLVSGIHVLYCAYGFKGVDGKNKLLRCPSGLAMTVEEYT